MTMKGVVVIVTLMLALLRTSQFAEGHEGDYFRVPRKFGHKRLWIGHKWIDSRELKVRPRIDSDCHLNESGECAYHYGLCEGPGLAIIESGNPWTATLKYFRKNKRPLAAAAAICGDRVKRSFRHVYVTSDGDGDEETFGGQRQTSKFGIGRILGRVQREPNSGGPLYLRVGFNIQHSTSCCYGCRLSDTGLLVYKVIEVGGSPTAEPQVFVMKMPESEEEARFITVRRPERGDESGKGGVCVKMLGGSNQMPEYTVTALKRESSTYGCVAVIYPVRPASFENPKIFARPHFMLRSGLALVPVIDVPLTAMTDRNKPKATSMFVCDEATEID